LHIEILLAFCRVSQNDKIAEKFYQLRTMDFLMRELSLEYVV
jgi:hypothetical protein